MKSTRFIIGLTSLLIFTIMLATSQEKKIPTVEKGETTTQAAQIHPASKSVLPALMEKKGAEAKHVEKAGHSKGVTSETKEKVAKATPPTAKKKTKKTTKKNPN